MIPFNNFKSESIDIKNEIEAATRVIKSGVYILGPELKNFENRWAKYCGISHAIGVGNGMDAIEIGLRALGIGVGDEIITTAMTAFATILAINKLGAKAVFADIDSETGLLSIDSAMNSVSSKTKAVLLVHLYGHMHDVSRWKSECSNRELLLIEDCAQSHGAKWEGISAGNFGEFGAYSFYPTKNLGAIGDAGAIITSNDDIAQKSRMILNYGQTDRYHHSVQGLNSRLDEIQAAILAERLHSLNLFIDKRREIAKMYRENINNFAITHMAMPIEAQNHVYHLYVIKCLKRDNLVKYLLETGIQSLIHYPIPAHKQFANINFEIGFQGLRNAETHANVCLSLPCNPQMSFEQVEYIIEKINQFQI